MVVARRKIKQLDVDQQISRNLEILREYNLSANPYSETISCVVAQAVFTAGFCTLWQMIRYYGWSDPAFLGLAFCGMAWFQIMMLNGMAVSYLSEVLAFKGMAWAGFENFNPWRNKVIAAAWGIPFSVFEMFFRFAPGYALFMVIAWYFDISPLPEPGP